MKLYIFIIAAFLIGAFTTSGCKPSHNNVTGGGKGGSATIIARVDHAGSLIDTAVVFIKYGTTDAPANGVYDDSLKVGTNYQAVFSNLTTGNYYLLAEGIHNPYNPNTVSGGRGWAINSNTAVDTVNCGTAQQNFTYPAWGW